MDQQRMEEDGVALLHLQVHPGELRVVATHSVVHLVNATLETRETVFMCVYLLAGIMKVLEDFVCVRVCVFIPPTRGSHAPAGCWCVFPAGRPGSRSACSLSPLQSRRRRSCRLGGTGSNADPDASGDGMSSYLTQQERLV